jgi:hypothetical protein
MVEKMPYVSVARVGLPHKRPTAKLVAERTRIFRERVEKHTIDTQRNDL